MLRKTFIRKPRTLVLAFALVLSSCSGSAPEANKTVDVVLIGGGIMSGTLGTFIKELGPTTSIEIYERLAEVGEESSQVLNNAGTGHSAFCELNYTPEAADGTIDTHKAVDINEMFEISKQFWAYQVTQGFIKDPKTFINNVPHMSLVWGDKNVSYLKKRYEALQKHTLFQGMEYSEDREKLKSWIPIMMEGRDPNQKVAATHMDMGTDVNFGSLTKQLFANLTTKEGVKLNLKHEVQDLKKNDDGTWTVVVKDLNSGDKTAVKTKFVFVGAGGGALKLLQKSGIPEANGFGGFPVGGLWLVTYNKALVAQHQAKVYGLASVGSPPMSVPHLDTRVIGDKKALLYGPFATFSTKFLKHGSWWDLPGSLDMHNLMPMIYTGLHNLPLVQYLIGQLMLNEDERLAALKEYFPNAKLEDWKLEVAGQRVQIVKKDEKEGGILQFGTELVTSGDGTIAALLGASPGASSAAPIILKVLEKSFAKELQNPEWQAKMKAIIPSYGTTLDNNVEVQNQVREASHKALQLKYFAVDGQGNATIK
ncbi:MAG: malate dehydrogenase (quinone) [Proteobacteria bacterium]|nr:MAG: malate dehydrogenase (quinone) [Pseudomonadota bacterium]